MSVPFAGVYRKLRTAIVPICGTSLDGTALATATAFHIGDGVFVTAAHVAENLAQYSIDPESLGIEGCDPGVCSRIASARSSQRRMMMQSARVELEETNGPYITAASG